MSICRSGAFGAVPVRNSNTAGKSQIATETERTSQRDVRSTIFELILNYNQQDANVS